MARKLPPIVQTTMDLTSRQHLLQLGDQIFNLRKGPLNFLLEGQYQEVPLMAMRKMAVAYIEEKTNVRFTDPLADPDFIPHEFARIRAARMATTGQHGSGRILLLDGSESSGITTSAPILAEA